MTLTVIIPAHNDEGPLHRLLRHMRKLQFADRIIVVDDGSEPAIAFEPLTVEVGLPPDRVTLLRHDHSRGAGAARNLALQHVTTEYVMFLDADDLPLRELPDLLLDLKGREFDFCIFQHHDNRCSAEGRWGQMPEDRALWRSAGTDIGALSRVSRAAAKHLCQTANYPWNKIYRTDFLREHNIRCTEIAVHNDVELHWRSFLNAKTILASDRFGVIHYVASGQGRLTNRNGPERLQVFTALSRVSAELHARRELDAFTLPFYRFAAGLLGWIGSFIRKDLLDDFTRKAHSFLAAEVPTPVWSYISRHEHNHLPATQNHLTRVSAAEQPAIPEINHPSSSRQVLLHIGLPKCGSTTIQRYMAAATALHQDHGVCYPQAWRSPDGYRNHLPLAKLQAQQLPKAVAAISAEAEERSCNRIVLSCEHWANAFPNSNLLALYEALKTQLPSWHVRIVAYFRNPYDFVESCYAQYVRAGLFQINRNKFYADGTPSIEKFLSWFEDSRGFPLYSNLGYARMLQAHFPSEILTLRSLEPQDLDQSDMLSDFCSLLDLPSPSITGRRNQRVSNRKLAELEFVQTLTDQNTYARLRQKLLETNFCNSTEHRNQRGTTLHIGTDIASAIAEQIKSEQRDLQAIFTTNIDELCKIRTGAESQGWARTNLLSAEDHEKLRAFVTLNTSPTAVP